MTAGGAAALLVATDLGLSRRGRRIIDHLDLTVRGGERLAVVGPSGCGKSSLLALLSGLAAPDQGEVRIDGIALSHATGPPPGVAVVLQGYGLVSTLTAAENVEVALRATGRTPVEARTAASAALDQVGLGPSGDHLVEELSGGQQQRTAVARALALEPRLLIADEPTAELDRATRGQVLAHLLEVALRGGALVLATHDADVAARCDRVLELHPT